MAERIAMMPQDLVQMNKRTVHRQMDVMGFRTGIRQGTELCTLGIHTETMAQFTSKMRKGLTKALAGARREVRRLPHVRRLADR